MVARHRLCPLHLVAPHQSLRISVETDARALREGFLDAPHPAPWRHSAERARHGFPFVNLSHAKCYLEQTHPHPIHGSSGNRNRRRPIKPRAIAGTRCSPPLNVPPNWWRYPTAKGQDCQGWDASVPLLNSRRSWRVHHRSGHAGGQVGQQDVSTWGRGRTPERCSSVVSRQSSLSQFPRFSLPTWPSRAVLLTRTSVGRGADDKGD